MGNRTRGNAAPIATFTSVPSAAADTALLAANENRAGAVICNLSTSVLYIRYCKTAAEAASAADFSEMLPATASGYHASLRIPDDFTGYVRGFWASANGSAKVTELTY